jgi:hypothetical protein
MKIGEYYQSKIGNVDYKNYSLGEMQSAYVGKSMISRKAYKAIIKKNMYQVQNDFSLHGGIGGTDINLNGTTGDTYMIVGKNEYNNPVVKIPGSIYMFGINKNGHWDDTIMSSSFWTSPIGSGRTYKLTPKNTTFKAVESQIPLSEDGYINHEIIFTGIGANGISLLYREYTFENMARPAFNQKLVYPIDSKEIRFRDYLIRINSVSASKIQYTVKSE